MAKVKVEDVVIYTREYSEMTKVKILVRGHELYQGNMPNDQDLYTWAYDKVFNNCPLSWNDFRKVKIKNDDWYFRS